ncbi:MAG TPA: hypothetical protein VMU93_00480 [Caulobacteraceae bacterium]|nr:hypothetical protein [Caulobacteraceae bacterium]
MNRRLVLAAALALAPRLGHAQDQRKQGGGESFIQMETLDATVTRADGQRGVMTIDAGLDVPDAGLRARARASMPLLLSAFGDVARTYAAGLPPGAVPNADYLSFELQRQTDRILGRPGAHLLLGTILVN